MIYYHACINVPIHIMVSIASLLAQDRKDRKTWRKISVHKQAVLALARLKNNETFPSLAEGFGISLGSAWRYTDEVIEILAAQAPDLADVLSDMGKDEALLVDGTLIRTDRVAVQGFYSGKHKCEGVNVQAVSDVYGNLLWLSPGLPGAAHDMKACTYSWYGWS